jgi:hypothetical protein
MMDRKPVLKHVEIYSKNKFEKLVHLVDFIIGIYNGKHTDRQTVSCHKKYIKFVEHN